MWVILTQELHPLWSDQFDRVLAHVFTVSGIGILLILVSPRSPRSARELLMVLGAWLVSPTLLIACLAPMVLYVNQSGGATSITCYPYMVTHKQRIAKKYVTYEIELSDSKGLTELISVSREQFDGLLIGVRAHVLVQKGLLGIPYVQQITQVQSAGECRRAE